MKADFEKGTKVCSHCKKELPLSEYCKNKNTSDGLRASCKECFKESVKRTMLKPESCKKARETSKAYYGTEKGKQSLYKANRKYIESGKAAIHCKRKRETDPEYKLQLYLRIRLRRALKGSNKSKRTQQLLGCTWEFFMKYFESQFQEGMVWKNYGINGWHIDHRIPCAYFDLTIEENQRICFNYRNFQPLWEKDNINKSDRLPENVEQLVEQLKKEIYECN